MWPFSQRRELPLPSTQTSVRLAGSSKDWPSEGPASLQSLQGSGERDEPPRALRASCSPTSPGSGACEGRPLQHPATCTLSAVSDGAKSHSQGQTGCSQQSASLRSRTCRPPQGLLTSTLCSELPTRSLMPIAPRSVALCPLGPHSSAWPHGLSKVFSLVELLPFSKHARSSPPDTLCPSPRVLSLCPASLSWSSRSDAMGSTPVKPSFPSMPSSSHLSCAQDSLRGRALPEGGVCILFIFTTTYLARSQHI